MVLFTVVIIIGTQGVLVERHLPKYVPLALVLDTGIHVHSDTHVHLCMHTHAHARGTHLHLLTYSFIYSLCNTRGCLTLCSEKME